VNSVTRLATFVGALAAAFGGAVAVGYAVGPLDRGEGTPAETHGTAEMVPATPAGLSVADGELRLEASPTTASAGRPRSFAFKILERGRPLAAYDVSHEKRMHVIVVRRDLTNFHHLHPVRDGDRWVVRFPGFEPGAYRVFADFSTGGEKRTLGVDLLVPGTFRPSSLPPADRSATTDGYVVALKRREGTLAFHVTHNGRTVHVDRYLGARGHLVILRAGDLAYLHTHADEDSLEFETTFPSAGRYRAFLQFSAGRAVHTAPFTIEVAR
jgi:hypothetical protein